MSGLKWYECPEADESVVISARVRLARNLAGYPFPSRLNESGARAMINDIAESVINNRTYMGARFDLIDLTGASPEKLLNMTERHIISRQLAGKDGVKAVIVDEEESISIMLNEEDHARIQSIFPGDNIDGAFESANRTDDLIDEDPTIHYAFDPDLGYLTACPTNTGTALRASYMLHLPALESSGRLGGLVSALGKFGMTVRGIHGEGSQPLGSIYQLSNQITLGKPEGEIIAALKSAAARIIEQEIFIRSRIADERALLFGDKLYRSYGILKNCRRISVSEAMALLSDLRLGFIAEVFDMPKPRKTIYNIMMDIQTGGVRALAGQNADDERLDAVRASYIRSLLY